MLRLALILIVGIVAPGASGEVPLWDLSFPEHQEWRVAASDRLGKEYLIEWTPADENLENWTELVTYNFKPVGPEYFRVMINRMMTDLSDGCQDFDSRTLEDKHQNRVVVWSSGDCAGYEAQKGVTRFHYIDGGILTLQYTFHPEQADPRFEYWKQAVRSASTRY